MKKTVIMLLGLAGVFAAGLACSGLTKPPAEAPEGTTIEACAGLSGVAKEDCERRHGVQE